MENRHTVHTWLSAVSLPSPRLSRTWSWFPSAQPQVISSAAPPVRIPNKSKVAQRSKRCQPLPYAFTAHAFSRQESEMRPISSTMTQPYCGKFSSSCYCATTDRQCQALWYILVLCTITSMKFNPWPVTTPLLVRTTGTNKQMGYMKG